jgi:hypothetical protein
MLDFDCCKAMSMDQSGVNQAVTAFLRNDPFYPRPHINRELWLVFRNEYLHISEQILRRGRSEVREGIEVLPQKFVQEIETRDSWRK